MVSFIDLKKQYDSIKEQTGQAFKACIEEFQLLKGRQVFEFEHKFSEVINRRYCISTANGTDSIFLTLKSLDIRSGDEVITPSWSWISSAETISFCGATPVFADVENEYYTIDPVAVEKLITPKTRAVVVVHLYGQIADMTKIVALCDRYNLFLIEDCAQAHLTKYKGVYAGSFGELSAFSFYPTKNLGAYGDAGCVLTDDDVLAERVRRLANHGALQKDDHLMEGINSRMDTIQAAVLLVKLPYLKEWNQKRVLNADLYSKLLAEVPEINLPKVRHDSEHTFHIYAIRAQKRDELKSYLEAEGVQTMIHYPKALTNLPAYKYLKINASDYPVSNALEKEILSLPIYPELPQDHIHYVCSKIRAFYGR